MASRTQITKNVRDVNTAWGRFQSLCNSSLYGWAGNFYSYATVFGNRRNYR